MTDFLQMINSKLNKWFKYLLGMIIITSIIYFGSFSLFNIFAVSHDNGMAFAMIGGAIYSLLLFILLFIFPFIIIYTSPKFSKKEKINFILFYICIYFFVWLFLGFQLANCFAILYLLFIIYLFWTHRKNDYRIEDNPEEIKE